MIERTKRKYSLAAILPEDCVRAREFIQMNKVRKREEEKKIIHKNERRTRKESLMFERGQGAERGEKERAQGWRRLWSGKARGARS